MFDAEIGVYSDSERELAGPLIDRLEPNMLMLADRGFYSFVLRQQAAATGADLLWRISKSVKPHPIEELSDGSWLVEIRPPNTPGPDDGEAFRVRLIDYTVNNGDGRKPVRSGCSPRCWTPTTSQPPNSLLRTRSGGKSSRRSTN